MFLLTIALLAQASVPGVTQQVYAVEGEIWNVPALVPDQTPNFDTRRDTIRFEQDDFGDVPPPFVTHVLGALEIIEPGRYGFQLISDDGSRLYLNDEEVGENDGRHGQQGVTIWAQLEAGSHPFRIEHFDAGNGRYLELRWQPPGASEFWAIPRDHIFTENDPTRVTSPGPKRLMQDAGRPGDRRPLEGVHPAWTVENIRPDGFEPKVGAMAFLQDGRLIVGTFNPLQRDEEKLPDIESKPSDKLYALSNLDGPVDRITVAEFADGFFEPSGMCTVGDDLYVAHRKAITRLRDKDGDGVYESRRDVASGWEGWNYHQFTFGLVHRDGKLYAGLSTAMAPPAWEGMMNNGAPNGPMRGTIIEVDLETEVTSVIAGGVRTPNGLGLGPEGSLWYADNQGVWMPANQLSEVIPGRFYGHYNNTNVVPKLPRFPNGGHPSAYCNLPRTPASILMPQGECANSPAQPLMCEVAPFAGQMLVAELTGGGIRRVSLEKVNGQWQGAVYRFTQGLESGVNRMAWGPDGCLYVGGIGAGGNWNWRGTQFGLQRLRPKGTEAFEIYQINAMHDGLWVALSGGIPTRPLEPADFTVKQWRYEPTAAYGGPKFDQEFLPVDEVLRGNDHGMNVQGGPANTLKYYLKIPGLRAGRVVHVRFDPPARDGEQLLSTEAWYTMNHKPLDPLKTLLGAYTPEELEARVYELGELLDDAVWNSPIGVGALPPPHAVTLVGRSAGNTFHPAKDQSAPRTGGKTQAELMGGPGYIEVGKGSGDIVSNTVFGDARLHIEWYVPPGGEGQEAGNSGIYIHDRYELQVLGTLPGDAPLANNEAGAFYGIAPAKKNVSTGPGTWQSYDILFTAPRFEGDKKVTDARATVFWNGVLVHEDLVLRPTGSRGDKPERPHGPLLLQDHSSDAEGPVRYRNIWIAPVELPETKPGPWVDLIPKDATELPPHLTLAGGKASYVFKDGVVTGTTVPHTANTFLVTRKQYGDFELVLEAWQHPELNSGIQIRSHVDGGVDNREGRIRGYQVELDPSDRAYSAGIYDEQRRGWLHPLIDSPYARRAYKRDTWNQIRIVAQGPVIRTWINGIPASEVFDAMTPKGHIGLQVHDVGDRQDPISVRFRNVRIREFAGRDRE